MLLTVEGAWLATKGYADDMHFPGMPALRGLMDEFIDNGGTIWACGACTKPRDITEDHLIAGASIIGAAKVVEEIAGGRAEHHVRLTEVRGNEARRGHSLPRHGACHATRSSGP